MGNRQLGLNRTVLDPHGLKNVNVEELCHFLILGLPSRSSLRSFSELTICPPSLKLRRDSLRSSPATRAKSGGKGIRTPGLLIANETLYQLSYTPVYFWKRVAINPITPSCPFLAARAETWDE